MTPLEQLAEAIEAGEPRDDWMPWVDPMDRTRGILPYKFANISAAYNGSLDAAKFMHDRLLPGWRWNLWLFGGATVWNSYENTYMADAPNPARAWLLAIVRAIIAQETKE